MKQKIIIGAGIQPVRLYMLLIIFLLVIAAASSCGGGSGGGDGGGSGGGGGGSSTTIGPNGGTVNSSDGKASVTIPAGALSQETAISVDSIASPGAGNIGTAYNFAPDGTTFSLPVTISIQYDDAALPQDVSEQNLKLGTFANNQWQEVAGSTVDTTLNVVSGSTSHFSLYGIIVYSGAVNLPKTGQTTCYDDSGNVITCGYSPYGQDGDYRKGANWPAPRFGGVTDNLTGLMWLRDANCIATKYPIFDTDGTAGDGEVTWQKALDFVTGINNGTYSNCDGDGGYHYTDWRLPNANELRSLVNYEVQNGITWLLFSGFNNVDIPSYFYWTSTTNAEGRAYVIAMFMGSQFTILKPNDNKVWPVRGGNGGTIQLPKTGQTTSYAAGDDGDLQMGVAWPLPRFMDNGDNTVTDNLTGLIWLKNANCIKTHNPSIDNDDIAGDGKVSWHHALDFVTGLNGGVLNEIPAYSCGAALYINWRLPNVNELASIIGVGGGIAALPETGAGNQYWTSTTYANSPSYAWFVNLYSGEADGRFKSVWESRYVWPVRGGQ